MGELSFDISKVGVSSEELEELRPWLIGEPDSQHEQAIQCPLHDDNTRSASLHMKSRLYHCFAGCPAATLSELMEQRNDWILPSGEAAGSWGAASTSNGGDRGHRPLTEDMVAGWEAALKHNSEGVEWLENKRGILLPTIEQFQIGYDNTHDTFMIPVRDFDGKLRNVRRYDPDGPAKGFAKMQSFAAGYGAPRLFPHIPLNGVPEVIIGEGELDAILARQEGLQAMTRTGAAGVWHVEWSKVFKDRVVFLAHDADVPGQKANKVVARKLRGIAADVRIIKWPWPIKKKHGKDLTNFIMENSAEDFRALMDEAKPASARKKRAKARPQVGTFADTFDGSRAGEKLLAYGTTTGREEPGYTTPAKVEARCSKDWQPKKGCLKCPLLGLDGEKDKTIANDDPINLRFMDVPHHMVDGVIKDDMGIPNGCDSVEFEVTEYKSIEVIHIRESVEHMRGKQSETAFQTRRVISVGKHDTPPNATLEIEGQLVPDPKRQRSEFMAHRVKQLDASIDKFEFDPERHERLKFFNPAEGQSPLRRRVRHAKDMANTVTKIYGREKLHVVIDLVMHSVLEFDFDGQRVRRGWLEAVIVGDTRTGKSEAQQRLIAHYQDGEMISGETATLAGVLGGVHQPAGGSTWMIQWGAMAVNDRRFLCIDEVTGLSTEEISQMSSARSEGEIKIDKIAKGRAKSRTRAVWLANPREGKMGDRAYGVDVIKEVIGKPEDVARFDLAMSLHNDEVDPNLMNRSETGGKPAADSDLCHELLMWVWSRKTDDVRFTKAATRAVYSAANDLGGRYTQDPPLIQTANVRIKVARIAAALAACTYSTTDGIELVIKEQHVKDAVTLLDSLYGDRRFGYLARSQAILADERRARKSVDDALEYMRTRPGLAKFMRETSRFKSQDIVEVLGLDKQTGNGVISKLHSMRMVRKEGGFVHVNPVMNDLLRDNEIE